MAVLFRTIADDEDTVLMVSTKGEQARVRRVAAEWFDSTSDDFGSFVWVCEILGLEPEAVRRAHFWLRLSCLYGCFSKLQFVVATFNAQLQYRVVC